MEEYDVTGPMIESLTMSSITTTNTIWTGDQGGVSIGSTNPTKRLHLVQPNTHSISFNADWNTTDISHLSPEEKNEFERYLLMKNRAEKMLSEIYNQMNITKIDKQKRIKLKL
jgi:hypothetical protein